MKKLINCLGKVTGKLVTKEDADHLVQSARALEAEGLNPIQAERQAVQDALDQALENGRDILNQIRGQRPAAYQQAVNFWERETIRKPGTGVPPPLPRFVTEAAYAPRRAATTPAAPVPAEEIVAVHNAPDKTGSTINAVHGNLIESNAYSVSIFPDLGVTSPGKNITVEQINAFAAKAQTAGLDVSSPNLSIGTWWDAKTDTTYVDVVFTTTDRAAAIAFGRQFNQKAIYDLKVLAEIPTGGTGIAPENLPSIAERIGILFPSGYDVGRHAESTAQAEAPAGPSPGSAIRAPEEGVPGGAGEVQPELGGIQQEAPGEVAPPEIPAAPISDAAQEVVNSLPEEQRNAAQKAFARDDRDPLADQQRRRGEPVKKRRDKPIAPEKNTKLIKDLSRYGAWDKTLSEVVSNIANDPKNPRWMRLLADLFVQIGLGDDVDIRAVNTPDASWGALYHFNKETGRGEILINLSHAKNAGLARQVLHELMHHGTLRKLTTENESELTPGQLAAKRELEKIFDYVQSHRDQFGGEAARYGARGSLTEFVSEIFANDALRRKLNSIRPDGKVSLMQRFTDAIRNLLTGDLPMRGGSLLEAAIKEALNVAGAPAVETSPRSTAAMQERRSRAARLANAFPNFQEQIADREVTAPVEVAAMADNMGITEAHLIERKLDHEAAFYADDERALVEKAVDERAGGINATPVEIAEVKKRIEDEVKYYRAYHPANEGWANKAIKVLGLEDKKGLTRGDPTKQNPSGIAFKIKYKDTPYTYARNAEGKPIQRFLKQGKPDKETGKPIDNPEWGKRAGQLSQKMFDNLQGIMARKGAGGEDGRIAQVILDQINWYRDMRTRLRAEFGSMSDYVADVIAGFSPITDVPGNWNNFIDYFRHVMRGDYDEAFRRFDEYISADPENRSSGTYKKEFPPEDFPDLWPRKLLKEDQPLFGANTGNALMAGLDLWRAIKSGTAPKARNFGLNLIGQSLKATIDRWAGRYLQRMHAPTWRIPPSIEGAVTGGHMPGQNVEFVSGDFGMGQDVFEDVAKRLQASGIPEFEEVTAADLQAILWFAEKEIWEMRKYTDIMGAGSSMNVVAQATAAQRYEAGTAPGKTSAKDEKLMAETIELRTNLNAEAHMLGAKMVPSVNIADGKESKTFDGEWVTEPEYDPENSIGYVARVAARLGKKAAHISRVIVNEFEPNPEMTPGLHIFFKGRVGEAEVKRVLDKLKAAGISNGISLTVDPRVRPEIIKSLDPAAGVNQYNGVRVQHIPEYETAGGMTGDKLRNAFAKAMISLRDDASVAESRVLHYDTLVLKKGVDYDSSGKLTRSFSEGRKAEWVGRARREGSEAAARRDNVQKAIADRKRQDLELESRMEREEQERIAAYAEFQRRVQPKDRANDGGVDPPLLVAAMQAHDESYRAVDQQWWKDFAAWRAKTIKKEHVFNFGPASDELRLSGFPEGNITLTQGVLSQKPIDEKHPFPVEALGNLPKRLRDPIAVFKSRSEPDALVVLTEIPHEGENIVVAVHFIPTKDGKSEITDIRSIYPKNNSSILGWISDGLTTYFNKEKARSWLFHRIAGSNSPRAWVQLRATPNVKTNEDVVKGPEGDGSTVAAMQYEDQQQPVRDPHGGRASLVRSMVERIRNISRDKEGIEVPQSEQEVRGVAGAGGRENQGRKGSAPIWRNLGATFRKREAALYSKINGAARLIAAANPEDPENPKDPARYQNSGALLDYLSGKQEPDDPELKSEIAELRKEIPVIPRAQFKGLDELDAGSEADVYHDPNSGVVYKFFNVNKNGGMEGSYVPGQIRLDRGGGIRIGMGERPTVQDFFSRMERANSHGAITPHELTAVTPEGHLVFAQPFVEGREVTQENLPAALARAGVHFLSDLGATSGIAKLPDGRWVVYDDLHPGNVRTMPGGRVEIIDANNRELDQYEINDLTTLGKMPPEKPPGPPRTKPTKRAQSYDNAVVVAPMVETHHGTPHDWAAEKRVRYEDGTLRWVPMDEDVPPGAVVVERAPAGRVRAEKVASGEGNAAYGWGVLYSAARKALAEWYRKELSGTKGEWLIDNKPIDYSEEAADLREALISADPEETMSENIGAYRDEVKHRKSLAEKAKTAPMMDSVVRHAKVKQHLEYADLYERRANALEQYRDRLTYRKSAGNVYTVQLDVDDPELLDWFKPMKDQMHVFDKVAARFGVTQQSAIEAYRENEALAEEAEESQKAMTSEVFEKGVVALKSERYAQLEKEHAAAEERWHKHSKQADVQLGSTLRWIERDAKRPDPRWTGEKFYEAMTTLMGNSPRAASEYMNLAGVPGIVFIDRESRKPNFEFDVKVREGQTETLRFNTQEEAEYARNSRIKSFPNITPSEIRKNPTFNNYVMFDPERIKVVAKNGEVVRTVADDLPAPPPENVVEPVTVAAMSEEDVKDDRDLTVAPMAATGRRTRKDVSVENYKPAGSTWARYAAPFKGLSWEVGKFVQQKRQKEAATTYKIQTMVKDFERKVKKAYKGKPSPEENKNIMLALGNLDNRLTQEQAREARKMTPMEREGFLHTAHMENVARFKQQQEQALNSLSDEIREAVNVLREELDLESKEALKDTGLDTELRARLDANQGVFLHSNAFQHFEDDVWGKRIKSDDPEALRIRRAAKDLFRNEITGENAWAYQKEQKAKGVEVNDEDALRLAAESGDLDQQIETRLDDYLNKQADEPSRLHMLMGKMPVTRNDAGKMLSLDRENIPKEIRELWGQYDDPAINFAKTLSILANHNAQARMQNSMLENGLENGYFWKQDVSSGPRPPGLVRMSTDTRGPMVGVYGPPKLKESLSLMNQRPVRSLLSELNSIPLMMKTVGSIASATRNLLGNPLFMVSNGNLPWSAIYAPKAFWLTLQRAADSIARPEGRKQLARMIELGVLDENVDSNILERIKKNARAGQKWESQRGFGASVAAVQRGFLKVAEKTAIPFQKIYMAADNFWRLANYNVELMRQKWMNPELSLEQQEENAAEITRKTLPTYSNIPEWFRESYGKGRDVVAPYLSFQAEAMRTYASSVYLAWKEVSSGKPKEMLSGSTRLLGLAAAGAMPMALGMASKVMFGYDDDDEKAIRAGLPEYQRNNTLFFLPRGPKGEPRFLDIDFMNPYSLVHKAFTAAWRGAGLGSAAKQLAKPIYTAQPVAQLGMDLWFNKDSRGGGPVYDEYDSPKKIGVSIAKRMFRDVVPGTATSLHNIAEAYLERDLLGNRLEKTGEKRDLLEEVMKVFPGTAIATFDRDKAMEAHVNEHKTAARNASSLFDKKISADGPVGPGEVGATYKEADERSFRAFQQMRKAYNGLLKLGMKRADAIKQMRVGFGSEIRKGGLGKDVLHEIVTGNYQRFEPSKQLLKETAFMDSKRDHKRLLEFKKAQQQQPPSRTASP